MRCTCRMSVIMSVTKCDMLEVAAASVLCKKYNLRAMCGPLLLLYYSIRLIFLKKHILKNLPRWDYGYRA